MTTRDCARGRAFGLPFFRLFILLTLFAGIVDPAPALAQNSSRPATPDGVDGFDSGSRPGEFPLDRELVRAETLFNAGETALGAGREAAARDAFDSALDVFVGLQGQAAADARVQAAYLDLIARINAAEVAAGAGRMAIPMAEPLPQAQAAAAFGAESTHDRTLAEMGDRIENSHPAEGALESNAAVLGSEVIDLPIELNAQVLGAIELYSGRFNEWFSRALSRGLPHLPRIREILAEAGVPEDLAYVPIVESAFNPTALSRAKAKGLWQFIPSTGRAYGLKQDFFVDERSNMEKATVAAAQYLKKLYGMFGDWNLALAGYNAGEGRVQRAIRNAKTNDFWALAKTRSFRNETKNYVPLIHAAIVIAKSPESYGIDVSPQAFLPPESVRVHASYPLTTVARCASADTKEIKQLNPDLRRGMTPSSVFDLKVPAGSGEQVSACLATAKAMDYTRHIVRSGDTLSQIGEHFGVPASAIAHANGLTLRSTLRIGVELAIPRVPGDEPPAKTVSASRETGGTAYRIRKGDTLSSVAVRHGTTVAAIKELNGLRSTRRSIGQVLRVASSNGGTRP